MKNFKKKALLPAIIMVMVSVIALSSATYAWFTVGNDALLGNLEVNVVAASGIQFSLDTATWKSSISTAEIQNVAIFPSAEIVPLSSNGKTNSNGRLDLYKGTINADGVTFTSESEAAPGEANGVIQKGSGNYIAFDLYVKVDKAAKLYLHEDSAVTSAAPGKGNLATRIAIVDQGYISLAGGATPGEAKALKNTGATAFIWEPNASTHAADALSMGTSVAGGASANPYKGVTGVAADIPNNPNGEHANLASVTTVDTIGIRDTAVVAELEAGISKLSVTIWLEGQDGDCVNSISGGTINSLLKFTKVDAE